MFVGDRPRRSEMLSPNKIALTVAVSDKPPTTYRKWNRHANQFPGFLGGRFETRKGDRVSICAVNRVEYLKIPFARDKLVPVLHVINLRSTSRELDWEDPSTDCDASGAAVSPKDSAQDSSQLSGRARSD